jgi:hypothetical protein
MSMDSTRLPEEALSSISGIGSLLANHYGVSSAPAIRTALGLVGDMWSVCCVGNATREVTDVMAGRSNDILGACAQIASIPEYAGLKHLAYSRSLNYPLTPLSIIDTLLWQAGLGR